MEAALMLEHVYRGMKILIVEIYDADDNY